jgi:hypothetical protein
MLPRNFAEPVLYLFGMLMLCILPTPPLDRWTPDRDLDRVPPPQVTGHAAHCAHSPQGATQAPWSQASLSRYGEHEPPRLLSRLPDPQVTEQAPQAPQREMFFSHDLDTPLAHRNWMKLV